jgi:hypothetical protein
MFQLQELQIQIIEHRHLEMDDPEGSITFHYSITWHHTAPIPRVWPLIIGDLLHFLSTLQK